MGHSPEGPLMSCVESVSYGSFLRVERAGRLWASVTVDGVKICTGMRSEKWTDFLEGMYLVCMNMLHRLTSCIPMA